MYVIRKGIAAKSERGAVAVVVAICVVMLFAAAAVAIDMGNAFARKRDVQNQADLAALAGAAQLPDRARALDAVAAYLNGNQPQSDTGAACLSDSSCVEATDLQNLDESDGEVTFPNSTTIRVVTPQARVGFGLATAVPGLPAATDVRASATAGIYSPGTRVMPAYAVAGCDQGVQNLTDQASGHTSPYVPALSHDLETNITSLDAPTLSTANPLPSQVDVNPPATTITITGNKLDEVTDIGFFQEVESSPRPEPITIPRTQFTSSSAKSITFTLPNTSASSLTASEGLWWIRVKAPETSKSATLTWSAVRANSGAPMVLAFRVGTPYLRCSGTSLQGNFGTLKIARQDSGPSDWLPVNIAGGLQPPLSLHTFDAPVDSSTGQCNPLPPSSNNSYSNLPTIYTKTTANVALASLLQDTNCVDTDTGLTTNTATAGLITWTGSVTGWGGRQYTRGRLVEATMPGCSPTKDTSQRRVRINNVNYDINNDVLSCFFSNGSTTVQDVIASSYIANSGKPVITPAIFDSPRFMWIPMLKVKPNRGGSEHYAVVGFRPAFLSEQDVSATKGDPKAAAENGLTVDTSGVVEVTVTFLNPAALQMPDSGPVTPYLGVGPKVVRLSD